jgi:hypothetical protein
MIPQIGDFIAIAGLAAKAYKALDSSRGSKFEFTSLLNTLEALSQAVLQAEALCMECQTFSFDDIYENLRRLELLDPVAFGITKEQMECEALIEQFLTDFSSCTKTFTNPGTGMMRPGVRKLTWIGHKAEIAALEKRFNGHLEALQSYLCAFY